MDRSELNQVLLDKKLVDNAVLSKLEKELGQQKILTSWEDFLVEKKVLSEQQLLEVKGDAMGAPSLI